MWDSYPAKVAFFADSTKQVAPQPISYCTKQQKLIEITYQHELNHCTAQ